MDGFLRVSASGVRKVRIWRPQRDPPNVRPFSDLSDDAQLVMEAILEESERKKQIILSQILQQQSDYRNYYNSIYRGSFNTDIPSSHVCPAEIRQESSPGTHDIAAPISPSLFSESFTQQDLQVEDTLSQNVLMFPKQVIHANNTSEPEPQFSPLSTQFSLSPLEICEDNKTCDKNRESSLDPVGLLGKVIYHEEIQQLHITEPQVNLEPTTVLPQNESILNTITEGPKFLEEGKSDDRIKVDSEILCLELSPLDSDLPQLSASVDNQVERTPSKELPKRKAERIPVDVDVQNHKNKPRQQECCRDTGALSCDIQHAAIPAKRQRLSRHDSKQDYDLDLIESMLSERKRDSEQLAKFKRKFKAPFKPETVGSKKAMPSSSADQQKNLLEPSLSSTETPSVRRDKFCFHDEEEMKTLNIVNIGYIAREARRHLENDVLASEEAIVTLVFKDGSTLFTSNSNDDIKRKMIIERKAVGVAIGYNCASRKEAPPLTKDVGDQTLACLYIPVSRSKENVDLHQWTHEFILELMTSKVRKVAFMAKEVLLFLLEAFDFDIAVVLTWIILDAKVAAWLLDPDNPVQSFEGLLQTTAGKKNQEKGMGKDSMLRRMMFHFGCLGSAMMQLFHKLQTRNLWPLFINVETRLIPLLAKMERTRMKVDPDLFLKFSEVLKCKLSRLEKKAHSLAGHSFCVNSHPQLRQVIFEELRLDQICKSKKKVSTTSVNHVKSTSEAVLTQLSDIHPLPAVVLEYRQLQKLKSTYVDGLMVCVDQGYLQTHWDQTAAATGRLTSYQPNLQSVPKQPVTITDYKTSYIIGKEDDDAYQIYARDPVVSEKGTSLLAADFQQIELRLLAHLSDDPKLISLFTSKTQDIFIELTSQWLGKSTNDVTQAEREQTKRVVYSVMYGAGKEKLAEYLKIDPSHAKALHKSFLEKFPAISIFTKRCTDFCQSHGYTSTIFKRRRLIPNINSKFAKLKAQAERQAVNFCVQGSAADICKAAMLQVEEALHSRTHIFARLLLQIHDELLYQVFDDHLEEFSELVKGVMESVDQLCGDMVSLKVPLTVSLSVGKQWGHLEDIHSKDSSSSREK